MRLQHDTEQNDEPTLSVIEMQFKVQDSLILCITILTVHNVKAYKGNDTQSGEDNEANKIACVIGGPTIG